MTVLGQLARRLDEILGAIDDLVRTCTPSHEESRMSTEPTSQEPQEIDPGVLAEISIMMLGKNDYGAFGRNLSSRILKQFIVANSEGKVNWEDGTGCFDLNVRVCVTPERPTTHLLAYGYTKPCLKVCVDGECVQIC
jgi:hypothetical protein